MRFRVFKWSVYGLLTLNLGLFLLFETLVEALDSLGWLVSSPGCGCATSPTRR